MRPATVADQPLLERWDEDEDVTSSSGNDHIDADGVYENDTTPGSIDRAVFGADIAFDQLWFRRLGNNLEVSVIGTGDRLSVSGWYSAQAQQLEQFHAGDGRMLLDSQVHTLVNAMATFAPPPMGQSSLSAAYREQLAPVLAANWQ